MYDLGRGGRGGPGSWGGEEHLGVRAEKLRDGKEKRVRKRPRQNTVKGQGRRRKRSGCCLPGFPMHRGMFPTSQ